MTDIKLWLRPRLHQGGPDFFGGSITNWSFLFFTAIVLLAALLVWRLRIAR